MKRKLIRNKKVRHGAVAVILTAMVLLVTVLSNVVITAVTERYSLYTNLVGEMPFDVTEDCYAFLERVFDRAKGNQRNTEIEILFCDVEENVSSEDASNYYIYHTANELAERFSNIQIECLDIFANPAPVKSYMTETLPTGEEVDVSINANSVIIVADGYHYVYNTEEFYVYESTTATDPWAYSGEKKLASAIMNALAGESPLAVMLNNHGEVFYDYELLNLLNDAGYAIRHMDLYEEQIPDNCDLLISYNPSTDLLTGEQLADVSETDILDDFLSEGGNSFLVFLGNATPALPNFESYLEDWGIAANYAENETTGANYRYMIKDPSGSLTTDGYTIYGECVGESDFASPDIPYVVFQNATSFRVTGEGYRDNHDGSYQSLDGKRTLYPLYYSTADSEAWANGKIVDDGAAVLMSVTEQTNESGISYVGVVSSVHFSQSTYLQSAVYGNADVLLHLLSRVGKDLNTEGLRVKPFLVQDISTVTTSGILTWTLCLSITPAVLASVLGVVILVRRYRRR